MKRKSILDNIYYIDPGKGYTPKMGNIPGYLCEHCGVFLSLKSTLRCHMETKNVKHITIYQCSKYRLLHGYKCYQLDSDEEYRVVCASTFGERIKEHPRAPSPMYDRGYISGHHISVDNVPIVGMKAHNITRTIKEAMYIRVNDPSLNRNIGKD